MQTESGTVAGSHTPHSTLLRLSPQLFRPTRTQNFPVLSTQNSHWSVWFIWLVSFNQKTNQTRTTASSHSGSRCRSHGMTSNGSLDPRCACCSNRCPRNLHGPLWTRPLVVLPGSAVGWSCSSSGHTSRRPIPSHVIDAIGALTLFECSHRR